MKRVEVGGAKLLKGGVFDKTTHLIIHRTRPRLSFIIAYINWDFAQEQRNVLRHTNIILDVHKDRLELNNNIL